MNQPRAHPDTSPRHHATTTPLRDDTATMTCPICRRRFTRTGRQTYCDPACRKIAFRRRHQQPLAAIVIPAARPRREFTIYECPGCNERFLAEQRCDDCGIFARRIGIGGPCPHCDQPVALEDLLDQNIIPILHNR
jgi:hypothetical protein